MLWVIYLRWHIHGVWDCKAESEALAFRSLNCCANGSDKHALMKTESIIWTRLTLKDQYSSCRMSHREGALREPIPIRARNTEVQSHQSQKHRTSSGLRQRSLSKKRCLVPLLRAGIRNESRSNSWRYCGATNCRSPNVDHRSLRAAASSFECSCPPKTVVEVTLPWCLKVSPRSTGSCYQSQSLFMLLPGSILLLQLSRTHLDCTLH